MLSAPMALVLFVVILSFKFTGIQIGSIIFSVSAAMIAIFYEMYDGCFNDPYFFEGTNVIELALAPLSIIITSSMLII